MKIGNWCAWIEVVGGEYSPKYDDERMIAHMVSESELCDIMRQFATEVDFDLDKYFRVVGTDYEDTFSTYKEWCIW